MKKKINKKLLNLIALCSGITATVGLGVGGVIYSLRQEKDSGDQPIDQKALPESVYDIDENNVLLGFKSDFLNNPDSDIYKDNFQNCDTMEIPARVTSIADYAFIDRPDASEPNSTIPSFITKLTFAEESKCTSIGEMTFVFSPFVSIVLPDKLSEIKIFGFAYCLSLASVNLSKCTKLSLIGDGAFAMCNSIKDIKIDNNFYHVEQLGEKGKAVISGKKEQTSWTNTSMAVGCLACGDIELPSNISSIANNAFGYCPSLTSVILPSNLTAIGEYAFRWCANLTSVTFPSSLTSIGDYAFWKCSSLTSVSFSKSLTTISQCVFDDCPNLSSITWDTWNGSFDSLDSTSFKGVCPTGGTVTVTNPSSGHDSDKLLQYLLENGGLPQTWAKTITLPEDVYNIENNVLKGFKDDFLNNSASPIYKDNFQDCNTIEIPASVTSIDGYAFFVSSTFKSTIPTFIKNLTFANNSNLLAINTSAFCNCSSLTSVTFPSSLTEIYNSFNRCENISLIDLSNCTNLSTIGSGAFYYCLSLTSVDLSHTNLTTLQYGVFESCSSLDSIMFPSSLHLIDSNPFFDCSMLNYIAWDLPNNYQTHITFGEYAFSQISSSGTVESLNPSITSQQLFDWIKTKGSFPQTGWGPVN